LKNKVFPVLSLTGGGILCYREALILRAIERALRQRYGAGVNLNRLIALVAGTSAGSIVGIAVRAGFSADDIVRLFRELGPDVFPRGLRRAWSWFRRGPLRLQLSIPRYDAQPLYDKLREEFGGQVFGELNGLTMAVSVGLDRKPILFRSWTGKDGALPAWLVAAASSAAHTYFPPVTIRRMDGTVDHARDGGYGQNDPINLAITQYEHLTGERSEESSLISIVIGKGEVPFSPDYDEVRDWGLLEEAIRGDLATGFIDANEEFSRAEARRRTPDGRFFLFNPPFVHARPAMDDARSRQFEAHDRDVELYLSNPDVQARLWELVRMLGEMPELAAVPRLSA